jgi:hypothetical protein
MSPDAKMPWRGTAKASQSDRRRDTDHRTASTTTDASIVTPFPAVGKEKSISTAPISWSWRGDNFVKIEPGAYKALCLRWKGPEWIPAYRRYGIRLIFQPLAEDVEVTMFINFGAKPEPPKSISSNYFKAWTIANGEAPLRGQAMAPTVFTDDGLLYTIDVEDAGIDPKTKQDKPPCLIYSRVKEILDVTRR